MFQDIFIIGATGKVGRTLVSQIFEKDVSPAVHNNPTRIIGLASRSSYLYDAKGISREKAEEFCRRKSGAAYSSFDEWLSRVQEDYPSSRNEMQLTFIDVTDGMEIMLRFHKKVMEETSYSIVTANKNPLALCDFKTFQNLTKEVGRYGYRCSVMAGAEAVSKIRDLRDLGDSPVEISGCFSGTLGYIASELEKGRKFSEIVEEAVTLGYTEPNPADDFS